MPSFNEENPEKVKTSKVKKKVREDRQGYFRNYYHVNKKKYHHSDKKPLSGEALKRHKALEAFSKLGEIYK